MSESSKITLNLFQMKKTQRPPVRSEEIARREVYRSHTWTATTPHG